MINLYLCDMLLFNVTAIADEQIGTALETWLRQTHFPDIRAAALFSSVRLLRVVHPIQDGITYCVQLIASGADAIETYKQQFLPALHHKMQQQYNGQLFLIESQMEFIGEQE